MRLYPCTWIQMQISEVVGTALLARYMLSVATACGAAELSRSSRTAREVRHISLWPLTKKGCWARHQGWAGYEGTRVGGCWICMLVGKKRECLGEWTPGGREHWEGREGHRTRRALGWAAEAKSICILARVCSGVGESPQTDEAT